MNKRLKNSILEVVDNQLRDNDPPFVRDIYEHLRLLTMSDQKAKEMIGSVVAEEIFEIGKYGRDFDEALYHKKLNALFDQFDKRHVKASAEVLSHPDDDDDFADGEEGDFGSEEEDEELDDLLDNIFTHASPGFIHQEPVVKPQKIYPNDPCPCGSGKKYKKCCGRV